MADSRSEVTVSVNDNLAAFPGASVVVTHPDGGVSEVIVYLEGDSLEVAVSPSRSNPFTIARDDMDIDNGKGEGK